MYFKIQTTLKTTMIRWKPVMCSFACLIFCLSLWCFLSPFTGTVAFHGSLPLLFCFSRDSLLHPSDTMKWRTKQTKKKQASKVAFAAKTIHISRSGLFFFKFMQMKITCPDDPDICNNKPCLIFFELFCMKMSVFW